MTFNYGKSVARIHNAMKDFTSQHARFPLDLAYLLDTPLKTIGPVLSYRTDDWAYLQALADKIRNRLAELPSDALEQGFCHGDFNGGNAHIAGDGTVTFFDFDCCGWGWRAYDFAVFRWLARINGQEQERWQPFLRGYSEEKKLNEIDLQAIPLFIAIRNIWILGLHIGNGHDWGFGWLNDKHFDLVIQFMHDWEAEYFAEPSITQL
jgi:Ser/Thr protein kinase RdoA (MazF antagonist)